jgi:methylated-DNA-protein-cysteine methyltransferase related protein
MTMSFRAKVYDIVRQIPAGRVCGYGGVAALCGSPRAARQVGYALAALRPVDGVHGVAEDPRGRAVPWQRVLRTTGHIAFAGDPVRGPLQQRLLEEEGIVFEQDRANMKRFRWAPSVEELER